MQDSHLPPHSFFAAPEGVYTLAASLTGVPATQTPVGQPAQAASGNAAAGATPNGGQAQPTEQPSPPPAYPSRTATVAVYLPTKESSGQSLAGLGMGMSLGGRRPKESDSANTPGVDNQAERDPNGLLAIPANGAAGAGAGGGAPGGAAAASGVPSSPTPKRRPLIRSFSMLGSLSLAPGNDGNDSLASSRPARPFKGSTSSFVRSWEGLPVSQTQLRAMADANAGRHTVFGFQTLGKVLLWHEIGTSRKDPLSRIVFSSFPTCVDANQRTATGSQVDLLVGFVTGDILWIDPLMARYSRFNKSGCITSSPVVSVQWLPPSPSNTGPATPALDGTATSTSTGAARSNLFASTHADGSVVLWDKDKDDWNGFVAQPFPSGPPPMSPSIGSFGRDTSTSRNGSTAGSGRQRLPAHEGMVVSKVPATDRKGQSMAKYNPVSHWRLSYKSITAVAFSPDQSMCAAVGEDGCLRIIDVVEEQVTDIFSSYFGAVNCVAWSPDGRYVATGGQDDLVSVYAPLERRIVAHCQGHSSWVTGVAWDAFRGEDGTLRIGSVGEDCKLILWDFARSSLTLPKARAGPSRRRDSSASEASASRNGGSDGGNEMLTESDDPGEGPSFHSAPRRDDVSLLQPAVSKTLSQDLFTGVAFVPAHIVLSTRGGQIKQFERPPDVRNANGGLYSSPLPLTNLRLDDRPR
ncbi:hypothetical protein JCM8202_006061 [Rhodotorula sphaerocarpa]